MTLCSSFPLGTVIDEKYRITKIIGEGSMGVVYEAEDLWLKRNIALKAITPSGHDQDNQRLIDYFHSEAIAMAQVKHPNVVPIHAFGVHHGCPYFCMEYVRGSSVAALINNNTELPSEVVRSIVEQAAQGLDAVHNLGLIHNDIKPGNLLFGTDYRVQLTDFGIAESIRNEAQGLSGSPNYLAPELFSMAQTPMAERHLADIYSFGITTFQLLTGVVPFTGQSVLELMELHTKAPVPSVRELRSDLPEAIEAVLAKALAKKPTERHLSGAELADDLRNALTDRPAKKRVLVVDDDEHLRTIYHTAFEVAFEDTEVVVAEDGFVAFELARALTPDLITVDLNMPRMDGLELCAALRETDETKEITIVVISAALTSEAIEELSNLGVTNMLDKPVSPRDLVEIAGRLLDT